MPSTATRCDGGIFVAIYDDEEKRMRQLPHIPFNDTKKCGGVAMFHSPDGFNIGYLGSGCSDLAIAICHLFNCVHYADQFKHQVIAKLDRKDYDIPFHHIEMILDKIKRGETI